jgi:hypothetical protein
MPIHTLHLLSWDIRIWTLVGQVPFLLLVVALFEGGRRRGWPWRSSALAAAAFAAGLSLGTACLPSVLGAVAGGLALWFAAQKVLGLRRPPIAVLTLGLVALIAVGRWGCLLNGCCFGTITNLPWAVHYDASTFSYFLHRSLGLLAPGAPHSLGVHPYPAYESLGLFTWLPFGFWLSKRLRSEGALLALTAAFDLALRGCIDGTRAMINVWWSLLGTWLGLDLFQWALLACAAMAVVVGWQLERRARTAGSVVLAPALAARAAPASSYALWLVYLGLCAAGWVSNSQQTVFLHRALLAALAACIPALAIPHALALRLRTRAWAGYALAGLCLLLLGLRMETGARADVEQDLPKSSLGMRAEEYKRGWIYEVDQRHGVIVRVGNESTDAKTIERHEHLLGLPSISRLLAAHFSQVEPAPLFPVVPDSRHTGYAPLPYEAEAPPPEQSSLPKQHGRTWVGGGFGGGTTTYSDTTTTVVQNTNSTSDDSGCQSNSTVYTTTTTQKRKVVSGWGQLERAVPASGGGVYWLGGRAGVGSEDTTVAVNDVVDGSRSASGSVYYGNLWAEYEDPVVAVGVGGLATHGPVAGTTLLPGGHLRLGHPRFGVDVGYADRASYLGMQSGHAGFSIAIPRGEKIRRLDDVLLRLFIGAHLFPGTDTRLFKVTPGFGAEIFITPRLVLGFEGAVLPDQAFGGVNLRTALGN